jgi:hypothetical protein
LNIGGVYIFELLLDVGAARSTARFIKGKRRGRDPAAEAEILNADIRPYREGTAAANDRDGRGVDHGRGYKAAAGFRQDMGPSFRDGPKDQTRNLEIPGSMLRIAPE